LKIGKESAPNPLTSILSPLEEERRTDRNAMKVRVQFYAQLRDLVGSREMDVDLAEGATVGDLLDQIYAQQPKLRPHDKSILIGAGVEFVDRNYKLKESEEISIMPPVQGG
jgi:MoaD family protein